MATTNRIKRIKNKSEIVEYGKDYIKYKDGSYYSGEIKEFENEDCIRHGFGKIEYFTGEIYEGEWKDNAYNGKGTYSLSDGALLYEGEWVNSKMDGQGKYLYADNVVYEGSWKDNARNGYGKLLSCEGIIIYEGEWKDDMKNGFGTSFYKEIYDTGDFYEEEYTGEWLNNTKTGKGEMKIKGYWDDDEIMSKKELQNRRIINDLKQELLEVKRKYNSDCSQLNMQSSYYNMFPPGEVYEFY
jgi:hypothetical protein